VNEVSDMAGSMTGRWRSSALLFAVLCMVPSGVCQISDEFSAGLPDGWKAVWDAANGQHYYWDTASGETTWVRPWEFDIAELDDPDDLMRGTGIERLARFLVNPVG
jgi:hypothetical protein